MMITFGEDGTRRFYDDTRLIGLIGKNKAGNIGYFFDTKNGLCEHEETLDHCVDCKPKGVEFLKEMFVVRD